MEGLKMQKVLSAAIICCIFGGLWFASGTTASAQTLPSETPQEFKPTNNGFEYDRRDVMIPMRDGVKLHTVIIVPKSVMDSKKHAPILLTRTPYNATELTSH